MASVLAQGEVKRCIGTGAVGKKEILAEHKNTKYSISSGAALGLQLRKMVLEQKEVEEEDDWKWRVDETDQLTEELLNIERDELLDKRGSKWYGDNLIQAPKAEGTMRLMAQNQDKFGSWRKDKAGDIHEQAKQSTGRTMEQSWQAWKVREIDVLMLGDTGWQDPKDALQAELYSAGKAERTMKRHWGGDKARMVSAEGYKSKNGWKGGTALATAEHLKSFAGTKVVDGRGLGRYVISMLMGANGCETAMVSWYIPTRSMQGAWAYQVKMILELKHELETKRGAGNKLSQEDERTLNVLEEEGVDPKMLLLRDLQYELGRLKPEYIIIGGDANTAPPDLEAARSRQKIRIEDTRDTERIEDFCEQLGLVEPYRYLGHDEVPRTWQGRGLRREEWSWIDYWLVSRTMLERGLVKGCGVMRDYAESTDHAAIYLDVDLLNLLGKSRLWEDIKESEKERENDIKLKSFGAVQLGNEERVQRFHDELATRDIEALGAEAAELWECVQLGILDDENWLRAESCMERLEGWLVDAQTQVYMSLPKAGRGRRKHLYSKQYVGLARQYRSLGKLISIWSKGIVGKRLKRAMERAIKQLGVQMPNDGGEGIYPSITDDAGRWERWMGKVQDLAAEIRRQMHGSARKKMRKLVAERKRKLKEWVENNELGKAFQNALKKQRDGAVETAHVIGEDGRRRAAVSGAEVRDNHQQVAEDWMGIKHKRWFYDGEGCCEGGEATWGDQKARHILWGEDSKASLAREKLADGEFLEDEELRETLPACFRPLAQCLQRVRVDDGVTPDCHRRRVEEADYEGSGLGEPIERNDWEVFWKRVKGHTRGGATGVTVDLIKACYKESDGICNGELKRWRRMEQVGEIARVLTNIARLQRRCYKSWREELLYFFIKNPGMTGLENSRPVGLLEVMFKCSEAFDSSAIMWVWNKLGLLQEEQWAFREGRGCEGPLMIWMMLSEEAFLSKEDLGEAETDSEKAFDSPTPEAIAISEARMGIPKWRIEAELRRKKETHTRVITPFGLTERFIRKQGVAQGGAASPVTWVGLMESLTEYVKKVAGAAPGVLPDETGGRIRIHLNLLADDQGYAAAGRGMLNALEARVEASTTWGTFFGINTKASKSWAALGYWGDAVKAEDNRLMHPWEHKQLVGLKDVYRGKEEKLRTVGPYENNRILGQQRSLAQYADGPELHAKKELVSTASAITQMPRYKWLATQVAQAVGWRRLAYRLRFTYVFESRMEQVMMPLKKALVCKLGITQAAPLGVLQSTIWQSGADAMFEERLAMCMRVINLPDTRGAALRGSIMRLQQYVGCTEPVMQTDRMMCRCVEAGVWRAGAPVRKACGGDGKGCMTGCGWNATWIGMLYKALGENGMQITGGRGLPKLRGNDHCLVDLAELADRDMVRIGCLATETWRSSEVLMLDGETLTRQMMPNGPAERTAGKEWVEWVRRRFSNVGDGRGLKRKSGQQVVQRKLMGWDRSTAWSWQLVAWTEEGRLCIGKPVGMEGADRLKVDLLIGRSWEEYVSEQGGPDAAWKGTMMTKRWFELGQNERLGERIVWTWDGLASDAKEVVVLLSDVRPVSAERWERRERWAPRIIYRIMEVGEAEDEYEDWGNNHISADWARAGWTRELVERISGMWTGQMMSCELLREQAALSPWGQQIVVFSDGGADWAGTTDAVGQYGVMFGLREGESVKVLGEAGGVLTGPAEWVTSHRSELMALITAVAVVFVWAELENRIEVRLDNDAVVEGVKILIEAGTGREGRHPGRNRARCKQVGYTNREAWMWERADHDLWEVLEGLLSIRVGQNGRCIAELIGVEWVRSHQDEGRELGQLGWEAWGNVWADGVCNRVKGERRMEELVELPRARSYRLIAEGREVIAPMRRVVAELLRKRRLRKYFEETRGWGRAATEWLGRDVPTEWLLGGVSIGRRIVYAKYMYALMWTDDKAATRWLTEAGAKSGRSKTDVEYKELARCSVCGADSTVEGRAGSNWHLVADCLDSRVAGLREKLEEEVLELVAGQFGFGWITELLTLAWTRDDKGRVRNLGSVEAIKEVMGEMTEAEEVELESLTKALRVGEAEWGEQRRLLYKGMLGTAWEGLLKGWGAKPDEARKLRKTLMKRSLEFGEALTKLYGEIRNGQRGEEAAPEPDIGQQLQLQLDEMLGSIKAPTRRLEFARRLRRMTWKRKVELLLARKKRQREGRMDKAKETRNLERQMRTSLATWLCTSDDGRDGQRHVRQRCIPTVEKFRQRKIWSYFGEGGTGKSLNDGMAAADARDEREDGGTGSANAEAVDGVGTRHAREEQNGEAAAQTGGGARISRWLRRKRLLSSDDEGTQGDRQESSRLALENGSRHAERGAGERRRLQMHAGLKGRKSREVRVEKRTRRLHGKLDRKQGQGARDSIEDTGECGLGEDTGVTERAEEEILRAFEETGRRDEQNGDGFDFVAAGVQGRGTSRGADGGAGECGNIVEMEGGRGCGEKVGGGTDGVGRDAGDYGGMVDSDEETGRGEDYDCELVRWLAGTVQGSDGGDADGGCSSRQQAWFCGGARTECGNGSERDSATVVEGGGCEAAGHRGAEAGTELGRDTMHNNSQERYMQQEEGGEAGVQQLQRQRGCTEKTTAPSGNRKRGYGQAYGQIAGGNVADVRRVRTELADRESGRADAVHGADAGNRERGDVAEGGLLQAVGGGGEEKRADVAEDDVSVGEEEGRDNIGLGAKVSVQGRLLVPGRDAPEGEAQGANRDDDFCGEEHRSEKGAVEVHISEAANKVVGDMGDAGGGGWACLAMLREDFEMQRRRCCAVGWRYGERDSSLKVIDQENWQGGSWYSAVRIVECREEGTRCDVRVQFQRFGTGERMGKVMVWIEEKLENGEDDISMWTERGNMLVRAGEDAIRMLQEWTEGAELGETGKGIYLRGKKKGQHRSRRTSMKLRRVGELCGDVGGARRKQGKRSRKDDEEKRKEVVENGVDQKRRRKERVMVDRERVGTWFPREGVG